MFLCARGYLGKQPRHSATHHNQFIPISVLGFEAITLLHSQWALILPPSTTCCFSALHSATSLHHPKKLNAIFNSLYQQVLVCFNQLYSVSPTEVIRHSPHYREKGEEGDGTKKAESGREESGKKEENEKKENERGREKAKQREVRMVYTSAPVQDTPLTIPTLVVPRVALIFQQASYRCVYPSMEVSAGLPCALARRSRLFSIVYVDIPL